VDLPPAESIGEAVRGEPPATHLPTSLRARESVWVVRCVSAERTRPSSPPTP